MASQYDVAQITNVSLMTVSRVVNGDLRVKKETREKVQRAIEELNYHPNAAARALNSQKTMTIGLILPKIGHVLSEPYFSQLIYYIEESISPYNYNLLISTAEHQNSKDLSLLYKQRKVDGLIIIGSEIKDERLNVLSENCIPTVLIHAHSGLPCINSVDVDNFEAIECFIDYLFSLGHRRIGFITGDLTVLNAYHRLSGYKTSLKNRGISVEEKLLYNGNWTSSSGYDAFLYFNKLRHLPTAVIASNDHMAIGFLKAAFEHDVNIPVDMSLVGIDDIEISSFTTPKLTTMRQPMESIGAMAVDTLIRSINNNISDEIHKIFKAEIVIRDSCGPCPSSKEEIKQLS